MILFSILLTAVLDMSLPEFQPELDLSGNYIEGIYDISSGEMEVRTEEELPDGMTVEAPSVRSVSGNDNYTSVVDSINNLNDNNNSYWELFLDSYPVEENHTLSSTYLVNSTFYIHPSNGIVADNGNHQICYVPVVEGQTYNITDIFVLPYDTVYYYGVVNSIDNPTILTNGGTCSDYKDFSFTANQNGYFVMSNWVRPVTPSFICKWVTIERESYTLSELGNAVMEIKEDTSMKFRILIFVNFWIFILPLAMKIRDHLFNLKHE